jgi:hypothetical protein
MSEEMFTFDSVIRGCDVYKKIWDAVIGEELSCTVEVHNLYDKNAVALMKLDKIVGHIPREHSKVSKFFYSKSRNN